MGGSSDPHLESGARLKKPRPDGGRSGTVDSRTLAVVRKCREDGGPKPPLSMDAARLGSARADAIVAIDGRISARIAASQCQ
jgi:hypothetical protein